MEEITVVSGSGKCPLCDSVSGIHDLSCTREYRTRYVTLQRELEAVRKERRFPMQRGPSIPWSLAAAIYEGYAAQYGRSQSLERLAERGGFSWTEVEIIYKAPAGKTAIDRALSQPVQPVEDALDQREAYEQWVKGIYRP